MSHTSNGWLRGSEGNICLRHLMNGLDALQTNRWLRGSAPNICLIYLTDGLEALQVTDVRYI